MKVKFKEYITEAIGIETVRKAIVDKPIWDYKNELVDEFDGRYRKIIGKIEPDDTMLDNHPLYNKLEQLFTDFKYILTKDSYIRGYVTKDKQQFKIGKLLKKLRPAYSDSPQYDGIADSFRDDPLRQQNRKPYLVVVSKHPYDVLGASTDRNWNSCVNLGGGIVYDSKKEATKGMNAERLIDSLYSPFMVAYLVDPDDVNIQGKIMIQRPLSRILIYPFKGNESDEDNIDYNWSIGDMYGINHTKFYDIVYSWVEELNESLGESEIYKRIDDVYYDNFNEELVRTWYSSEELLDQYNEYSNGHAKSKISIGSIDGDWDSRTQSPRYAIHDVILNNCIDKDIFNRELMQYKKFYERYFEQTIRELLMHTGLVNIFYDASDLEIFRIYDNTGSIQLQKIPLTTLPEYLENQMGDEDELNETYGPNYMEAAILEYLKKYTLNDYDYYNSMIDSNLGGWFDDLEQAIKDKLLELGVDPELKNWEKVEFHDASWLEETSYELHLNFAL